MGKAGIATFVMRQHEYLVVLKAENGLLTLHTLHRADEIRDPKKEIDTLPGKAKASDKELQMAEQLIGAMSPPSSRPRRPARPWRRPNPPRSRQASSTLWRPCAPASSAPEARRPRAGRPGSPGTAVGKKPAAKKGLRSAPKEDLTDVSKAELCKKAAAANVPGHSNMTRDDLVKALSRA
ncbi:Ku protein [Streptomyces goshikiensis]|uniref:Ku protein n=1 Tax=Streptomyces goshikiensis TaxID=1942 RepID=UPI0036AB6F36